MLKTKKIPCPFRPEHTKRSQKSKFLCPTKRKKIFFATLVFVSIFTGQNNVFKLETHISMHLRLSSTLTDHLKRKEKYIEYIWNECFGQRFQKPSFSLVFGEKERFQNAPLLKLLTEVSVFISKNATKTMPFRTTTPHQCRCSTFIQLVSAQLNVISMYTLQKNSLCVEQLKKFNIPFREIPPGYLNC